MIDEQVADARQTARHARVCELPAAGLVSSAQDATDAVDIDLEAPESAADDDSQPEHADVVPLATLADAAKRADAYAGQSKSRATIAADAAGSSHPALGFAPGMGHSDPARLRLAHSR